ncbi:glutaredoxin-like, Thioredoxin-like fold protein [Artemisia annua]|uniref:Glutaredoxin-like protein n=1 Tax=Artemisia annua TaxID=35608 RepID=A0A2U1NR15_ARTAN|nr:glutaredoxin-like, Thioredoxin-like fold protein [Artemisia annua]
MTAAFSAAITTILHPARRTSPSTITTFTRKLTITASSSKKQLILYSKPGCCLCDGLKEKLNSAFTLASTPEPLHDVELQIRDISSNPEWEKAYQYEIPVLARLRSDGSEEVIPRFSPRAGVDHIQTKLAAVLSKDN